MIKKAPHIIMAATVLISTMGITINMHFCHDHLIDIALYLPAESCCDKSYEASYDAQEKLSQTDHCEDDSIVLEALDDFMGSSFILNLTGHESIDLLFWLAFHDNSRGLNEDIKSIAPENHLPPLHQGVSLAQIQSFLI
jgi:hypothetical protein